MEKLKMQTPDRTQENVERIAQLFPNVITESRDENGNLKRTIDFDLLRQHLADVLVEDDNERYRLDWPGKKASLLKANTPVTKTLRPCRKESVNFDTTENLYIEGDNFEVLKILQESYLGKIKMIYIDEPYNTGNDFIYKDNFTVSKDEYEEILGVENEEGGKLFKNTDSNGRFHSDWLSMMYERLLVSRDLLRNDGMIFISVDDNEVHNLRKICDEIFGEQNLISELVWKSGRTAAAHFTNEHEYVLCYAKDKYSVPLFEYTGNDNISDRAIKRPSTKNPITAINFPPGIDFESEDRVYPKQFGDSEPIKITKGIFEARNRKLANAVTIEAAWTMKEMITSWLNGSAVVDQKGQKVVRFFFKSNGVLQYEKEKGTVHPKSIIEGCSTKQGGNEIIELFGVNYFSFPKPTQLIRQLAEVGAPAGSLILDFFSGSATTAHAVMQLNAEDGGKRKYIMVQLPEKTAETNEAYKAGYKTIADIGKERIRRAGKKILQELKEKSQQTKLGKETTITNKLDIGFRVYKTDTTNMKDVFYHPTGLQQSVLGSLTSNIKEDRTSEDLLTQVLLDLGLELSLPIEQKKIRGNTVFIVQTNALIACFDDDIDFKIIDEIADLQPLKVVFKDASFKDDKDRINVEERFKRLSPETRITVL